MKSQVLCQSGDEEGSVEILRKSVNLRDHFCAEKIVPMEQLKIEDFDEFVAVWNR